MHLSNHFISILVICASFIAVLEASSKYCSTKSRGTYGDSSDVPTSKSHDHLGPAEPHSSKSHEHLGQPTDPTGLSGSGSVLLSSPGPVSATYYYGNGDKSPCGEDLSLQATGATFCESHVGAKPLNTYGNNIVAMAHGIISQDPAKYCGKEVQVFNNGKQIFPADGDKFIIWDACMACDSDNHLDFSVLSLHKIFGEDICHKGMETITWKIVDNSRKSYIS